MPLPPRGRLRLRCEISTASQEQRDGIEQVTQQNAALVEEAAAATESMREQAGALAQAVSVFKLDRRNAALASIRM